VYVVLRLLGFSRIFVGFGEGVKSFKVFYGHKLECSWVPLGWVLLD
jgi:hypothetical protein